MIKLEMDDWLKNAGIIGLYNILKKSEDEVIIQDNTLMFEEDVLENFEEKYFAYFIEKYKSTISVNKIINFEEFLIYNKENDFEEFDENKLDFFNKYIENTKRYLKSNSYKAAYLLVDNTFDFELAEKNLKKIKLKKKQQIKEVIPEIKECFSLIEKIIERIKKEDIYKHIAAKNVIYTIIKNGWDGICFLNPQSKEKDVYTDLKKYFLQPITEYLQEDKTKYKYQCFSCGEAIKNLKNDYSFIQSMGFDTSRKPSHTWNFNNDIAMCPICKLIYSCIPAGITYVMDKGIFINDNSSVDNGYKINNAIYSEIYNSENTGRKTTYRALIQALQEKINEKRKYELVDVQMVQCKSVNEKIVYKFNILSKKMLKVLDKSKDDLNYLIKAQYKELGNYFNIYEIVIDRIMNNQNQFTLVQKLLHYKLSMPRDCMYSKANVNQILKINMNFFKEVGYMEQANEKIITDANKAGYFLREAYRSKNTVDKLGGISYKLLNSLKTNNKDAFMDTVLNCYLYVKNSVPKIILDALKSDEEFKTIGYAFVTGLIEGKDNKAKSEDK